MVLYNIYNGTDSISQLFLGRSLRNGNVLLYLIKGLNDTTTSIDALKHFSSKCDNVFYNKSIEKPTYDETQILTSKINGVNSFSLETVKSDLSCVFYNIDNEVHKMLSDSIYQVFTEVKSICNPSLFKNGYIRTFNILVNRLNNVVNNLKEENGIFYVGKPDKFDILAFTVLGLCGVDVVICDLTPTQTSECLCVNRFQLIQGSHTSDVDLSFLSYSKFGIKNLEEKTALANRWVDFNSYSSMDDYLNLMNFKYNDRFEKGKWKVLNICLNGVSDIQTYNSLLVNFKMNIDAIPRRYDIFDGGIVNATYEETDKFNKLFSKLSMAEIFKNYPIFNGSGIPIQAEKLLDSVEKTCGLDGSKLKNFLIVLKIWLIRYLDKFYSGSELTDVPLIIVFATLDSREKAFMELLGLLPIDIIYLNPDFSKNQFSTESHIFNVGKATQGLTKFPQNAGAAKVSTVAYNAERDLDTILYNDTSLFRIKQFKKINPIVLKTTYEEISILWNEVAKVRPSFNCAGNLVTVPTIFAKVNGVTNTYIEDIKKLQGKNTFLFTNNNPLVLQQDVGYQGQSLRDFAKHLVFRDEIDYERLFKSKFYTYSVYSEETQELIREKCDKLIHMNWCVNGDKNIVYDIIDTIFRLPPNILQAIHNYDFTADIPKVIMYNGGNIPCSIQECIALMFLSLVGFDVVIFTPTGYRVVEHCINSNLFNEITVGQFDFNLTDVDFRSAPLSSNNGKKRKGLFGLFN